MFYIFLFNHKYTFPKKDSGMLALYINTLKFKKYLNTPVSNPINETPPCQ